MNLGPFSSVRFSTESESTSLPLMMCVFREEGPLTRLRHSCCSTKTSDTEDFINLSAGTEGLTHASRGLYCYGCSFWRIVCTLDRRYPSYGSPERRHATFPMSNIRDGDRTISCRNGRHYMVPSLEILRSWATRTDGMIALLLIIILPLPIGLPLAIWLVKVPAK